jgi:hypothetical protein
VYEDAVRDVECRLGPRTLARLAAPLEVILNAGRWLVRRVFDVHRGHFRDIFVRESTNGELPLTKFLEHFSVTYHSRYALDLSLIDPVLAELDQRFAQLFGDHTHLDAADAVALSSQIFSSASERSVPFHSADVMLAAETLEAFDSGRGLAVLGELHPGFPGFTVPLFVDNHPNRRDVLRAHLGGPGACFFRTGGSWRADGAFYPSAGAQRFSLPGADVMDRGVRAGDIVLRLRANDVWAHWPGGSAPLTDLLVGWIRRLASHHFRVRPGGNQRRSIGDMVVQRQSWRLKTIDLTATSSSGRAGATVLRSELRTAGVPRFSYAKLPKQKPLLVDQSCTASLENLLKYCGDATHFDIVEMLPTPEESWLSNARGERCAAELRFMFRDGAALRGQ